MRFVLCLAKWGTALSVTDNGNARLPIGRVPSIAESGLVGGSSTWTLTPVGGPLDLQKILFGREVKDEN